MPGPIARSGGELSGELLSNLMVIPNGYGITDIDPLYEPMERRNGASRGGLDERRLVHMEELFVHGPNETVRKAADMIKRNGADPSKILARPDIIMSGAGITRIDELFEPIEAEDPSITDQDQLFEAVEPEPVVAIELDPELAAKKPKPETPQPRGQVDKVLKFLSHNVALPEGLRPVPEAG